MATVTLRQIKGSPLTNAELDANLTNINAETVDNSTAYRLRPSLDVDLVGSKTVSPLLSFSRGSTGTYYDGKTAVKAEENLIVRSQEFDSSAWGKSRLNEFGSGSVANTTATLDPVGGNTADFIQENAASGTHYLRYQSPFGVSASDVHTLSLYAKSAGRTKIQLWSGDGSPRFGAIADLSSGTITPISQVGAAVTISTSIASAGNGWYRITCTGTHGATGLRPTILLDNDTGHDYQGDGVSGIYIWGAQLEQRSQPTAYTPTTTAPITNYIPQLLTAPTNTPRFDHDPVTGELKGMIVEESRTNLLTYSEDFHVAWSTGASVINSNVAIAPDGTQTADLIVPLATNSSHKIVRTIYPSTSNWTFSVYVKSAGVRYVALNESAQSGSQSAILDLTTGGISGGYGVTNVSSVGGGWYRISWNYSTNTSNNGMCIVPLNAVGVNPNVYAWTGDGYSGIYVWGAQFESGSQATSYIPTPLTYTSRASTATYKGDDGYLKTAAINEARYERNALGGRQLLLEGAGSNILTRTERFDDSYWNKSNATIVPNASLSPNGTYSADAFIESSADGTHVISSPFNGSPTNTTTSFFVKPAGRTRIHVNAYGSPNEAVFDLTGSGSVVSGPGTISVASNGWYRCSVATGSTVTYSYIAITLISSGTTTSYVGNGTSGVYIWGAQLETGSVATSYMPSTETFTSRASTATYFNSSGVLTTAAIDTARTGYAYDASRNQWISQGLIIEPAATNLLTYSDQFDNVAWSNYRCSVSANSTTAPDGNQAADSLIEDTTANESHLIQPVSASSSQTTGTTITLSVYAKPKGRNHLVIIVDYGSSNKFCYFNIASGVVGTIPSGVTASIQPSSYGFYRCSITFTMTNSQGVRPFFGGTPADNTWVFDGDGTSGIYVWGAQLETGSVATSYIPTTTAQVTRAADVYTSTAGSRAADVYSSSTVTRSADQLSISKTSNWFNSVNGTLALAHDAVSGQPLLGDGSTTILSSLGAGTINIDYSNSQLSVVTQSGQTTATQGIFNFDSDLQILGNSTTKANARIKYMKFYPNNVIGSTPDGSGFILDDGYAMLQEDGSVLFQE